MRLCQPGAQLLRQLDRLIRLQAADALHQGGDVLPVNELHSEEGDAVGIADVEDPADVRMGDLARDAHLAVELRQVLGIASAQNGKELQCNCLPEAQIIRAINLSHAAVPDLGDDAVPFRKHRAGHEAGLRRQARLRRCRGRRSRRGRSEFLRRLSGCGLNRCFTAATESAALRDFRCTWRTSHGCPLVPFAMRTLQSERPEVAVIIFNRHGGG